MASVIVVGAGPSGLLLALNLARKGISVHVLEASTGPDTRPRATHYGPAGVYELRRSGLLDTILERGGLTPSSVTWRAANGDVLAELPQGQTQIQDRVVSLPLNIIVEILLAAVRAQPSAQVSFGHRILDAGQDHNAAWVEVEVDPGFAEATKSDKIRLAAKYVVGCDGASSQIRHSLFGSSFPGYTWDKWLMAVNVIYDGFDAAGWTDINFVIHPTNWCLAARIGGPDALWRVTYGEDSTLGEEECIARVCDRLSACLPGQPTSDRFKVVSSSPYRIHQRCAPQFRVGRILLAADAAHLCNPMGGMGLTNGIVDVGGLSDCLLGIFQGVASEDILNKYDIIRRGIFENVVNEITTANLKRLMNEPKTILATDKFLIALRNAKEDAAAAANLGNVLRAPSMIKHDFTQYYESTVTNP